MIYAGLAENMFREYEETNNKEALIKDTAQILVDNGYLKASEIFLRMMLRNDNGKETE